MRTSAPKTIPAETSDEEGSCKQTVGGDYLCGDYGRNTDEQQENDRIKRIYFAESIPLAEKQPQKKGQRIEHEQTPVPMEPEHACDDGHVEQQQSRHGLKEQKQNIEHFCLHPPFKPQL